MPSLGCEICGAEIIREISSYRCSYCSHLFCNRHRLPEKHACQKIELVHASPPRLTAESLSAEISEFERARRLQREEGLLSRLKRKLARSK